MRRSRLCSTGAGMAMAGTLAIFVACSDSPTGSDRAAAAIPAAFNHVANPGNSDGKGRQHMGPTLHFARVRADGELRGGTATGIETTGVGRHVLTFPVDLEGCAATAHIGTFPGSDFTRFPLFVTARVDVDMVEVVTRDENATSLDSAFMLILACH